MLVTIDYAVSVLNDHQLKDDGRVFAKVKKLDSESAEIFTGDDPFQVANIKKAYLGVSQKIEGIKRVVKAVSWGHTTFQFVEGVVFVAASVLALVRGWDRIIAPLVPSGELAIRMKNLYRLSAKKILNVTSVLPGTSRQVAGVGLAVIGILALSDSVTVGSYSRYEKKMTHLQSLLNDWFIYKTAANTLKDNLPAMDINAS